MTHHLYLTGLEESEASTFIEATANITPPRALVSSVHRETEGNPLFMGEVIRLLAAEGKLEVLHDAAPLRITIPARIREVIERRLRRLPGGCIRILTLASVLGREFGLDPLQEAGGLSRVELLGTLEEAVAGRVVTEVPGVPGRMSFTHFLFRDVLYEALTPRGRVERHREIGEVLERLYARDPEPHLAELALHLCRPARPAGRACS